MHFLPHGEQSTLGPAARAGRCTYEGWMENNSVCAWKDASREWTCLCCDQGQQSCLESCKLMCRCHFLGTGMQSCTDSWDTAWQSGVRNSRPRAGTSLWPVRNWTTQQEVSGGWLSKASSVFIAAPHRSHYCLSSASYQISGSTGFSEEHKPDCELHMWGI